MRAITITTANYVLHARRLVRTLNRQHPGLGVVVYADDAAVARAFEGLDARVEVLPTIASRGVKRAKFDAYARAAAEGGGFLYLDADILVLQPLDALLEGTAFIACRDDLRECTFIGDPTRPWVAAPELSGAGYFNSGVLSIPHGFEDFFQAIAVEAADDHEWARFTIPAKLYDNHFLCAKVAQRGIPVHYVSEYEYNWQGFRSGDRLNCYVDACGVLRSRHADEVLRLVHFAGVGDIEDYLCRLPLEVAEVLARALGEAETGYLEMINSALQLEPQGDSRHKLVVAQAIAARPAVATDAIGAERPLIANVEALTSIVHSCDETDCLWNGLPCGGAYLSAIEYWHLRAFIRAVGVQSILEFGAGYTTSLFARMVKSQLAIEAHPGPWLDYARSQGCDTRLVSFSDSCGFAESELRDGIGAALSGGGPTMLFLDSPQGTARRAIVARQIVQWASEVDYLAVHDSVRDASVVYYLCSELGLSIVGHVPSMRGLTFLGRAASARPAATIRQGTLTERVARMRFGVDLVGVSRPCVECDMPIKLTNVGSELISAASDGLLFSLHVRDLSGEILAWDTPRYALPVDLQPADSLTFRIKLPKLAEGRNVVLVFDFVKEGQFWWSGIGGAAAPSVRWCGLTAVASTEPPTNAPAD